MKKSRIFLITLFVLFALNFFAGCQEDKAVAAEKPIVAEKTAIEADTAAMPAVAKADVPAKSIPGGTPKIVFDSVTANLGKMEPGQYYNAEFTFTNRGTGELIIEKTHATCGCTVPQLDKKNYAPGESGTIKVRYHAQKSAGKVNKGIDVYTNEEKRNTQKLTLAGYVELTVTVEPATLQLSLKEENGGAKPITVRSTNNKPFSISEIRDYNKALSVGIDPAKKATEFTFTPVVDMEKLKAKPSGVISIKTLTPAVNQLNVSYAAPPLIDISRPRIIIQGATPGQSEDKEVWITSNYGDDFEIKSIVSRNHMMEVASQEKIDNRVKLIVKVTPPLQEDIKKRHFTDVLDIQFGDGETATITCTGWFDAQITSSN